MKIFYQDFSLTLYSGDALSVLSSLPDDSIPCCVTSPPYDDLRTYGGYTWDFSRIAEQLFRVMEPGGVCCWNVNDQVKDGSESLTSFKQAIYFVEQAGFRLHDTMIYGKSNGAKPDPRRYNQCFEYIFILSKGTPARFNPIRDKKNVTAGKPCFGKWTTRERDGTMTEREYRQPAAEYGVRSNIWFGNTAGQELVCQSLPHPAMMPEWLARDLVLTYSNPGDTVLDPFAGSGTTGKAAIELGRKSMLIEINPEYLPLIKDRTSQFGFVIEPNPLFTEPQQQPKEQELKW